MRAEVATAERLAHSSFVGGVDTAPALKSLRDLLSVMPQVHLDEETVARLDSLREEDEDYDEIITELINIYEAEELTLFRTGDEV